MKMTPSIIKSKTYKKEDINYFLNFNILIANYSAHFKNNFTQ